MTTPPNPAGNVSAETWQAANPDMWQAEAHRVKTLFAAETLKTSTLMQALLDEGHRARHEPTHDLTCRGCAALREVDAIDPGTDVPSDAPFVWRVWWWDRDGEIVLTEGNIPTRERAETRAKKLVGQHGIERYTVVRIARNLTRRQDGSQM